MGTEYVIDPETKETVSSDEYQDRQRERHGNDAFRQYLNTTDDNLPDTASPSEVKDLIQRGGVGFAKLEGPSSHAFVFNGDIDEKTIHRFADRELDVEQVSEDFLLMEDPHKDFHELSMKDTVEKTVVGYQCTNPTIWNDFLQMLRN